MTRTSKTAKSIQFKWRLAGVISLAVAGLMAAGATYTGILHDTAVHTIRLFADEVPENVTASNSLVACILYWAVFLVALFSAVYLAFIDMQYIRLQYAIEKQRLLRQSLGEDLASSESTEPHEP